MCEVRKTLFLQGFWPLGGREFHLGDVKKRRLFHGFCFAGRKNRKKLYRKIFLNINCLKSPQHSQHIPNVASKMAQHRANVCQHGANIRQHTPNLGQHRPNIGQPRPNVGSTWALDVPNIDHMGPTWLNLGRRCAFHFAPYRPHQGQHRRERERQRERGGRTRARRLSRLPRIPGIRPGGQPQYLDEHRDRYRQREEREKEREKATEKDTDKERVPIPTHTHLLRLTWIFGLGTLSLSLLLRLGGAYIE